MSGVVGKRSPRWAFWKRLFVPCANGDQYLVRLRIVQTPWFGIYLHDIYSPDGDRDPHNHPWSFVSIILRGRYVERVYPNPGAVRQYGRGRPRTAEEFGWGEWYEKRHHRFSAHRMDQTSAHRVVEAAPGLKTLVLVGPRRSEWGFFVRGDYVQWDEYEGLGFDVIDETRPKVVADAP